MLQGILQIVEPSWQSAAILLEADASIEHMAKNMTKLCKFFRELPIGQTLDQISITASVIGSKIELGFQLDLS